jgi:hypothetical protein
MQIQANILEEKLLFSNNKLYFYETDFNLVRTITLFLIELLTKNIKPVQQTYKNDSIYSQYLQRTVTLSIIIPTQHQQKLSLLLVNDGQDFPALGMQASVESILGNNHILPFLTVGIHCNHERILEYGTASASRLQKSRNKSWTLHAFCH